MSTRKEIKQGAVAAAKEQKLVAQARATELSALPQDERKASKAADRLAAKVAKKDAKAERKQARASMSPKERRQDKRQERIYRKVKNRPRRAIGWGITGAVVLGIGIIATPYVQDISRLLSIEVDSHTAQGQQAREHSAVVAEQISDEGIVLLKNDQGLLPLTNKNLNVFSFASFNLRYGGGGSGGADQSRSTTLYDGLTEQGITYNPDLYEAMGAAGAETDSGSSNGLMQIASMFLGGGDEEPAPDYLTDEVLAQAQGFSDTALIVMGNDGVEASDFAPEQLRATENQLELLDRVTANFDNVIVVINSGNQMELGFLEDYPQVKSALWIGTPGPRGAVSLAKILDGEVNPSGRLTSTYAHDVRSAPAAENFGDYKYTNAKRSFLNYNEGIYVGYRFYETFYQGDEAGYAQAVQFPFGFGLSYTDFEWETSEPRVDGEKILLDVLVTNTGQVAGKDVVQVYYSAPYTPGGIEKSAIELAGYAKTGLLEPGASATLTIEFDQREMASWDETNHQAYVLEAGTYQIKISRDVHVGGDTFTYEVTEEVVYDTDGETGAQLQNRFDYATGDLTYLSRDDWQGTYPDNTNLNYTASETLIADMNPELEPQDGAAPTYGAENGLQLGDLKGLDYDDPKWDLFLDQFTAKEQVELFSRGAYQTQEIERLGVPSATLLDGPAGINFFFGNVTAASFPTEVVIAATWNDQLGFDLGEAVGSEANAYGVQGWYAPGVNIHRTAMGGRNFEYFSEDPLLSGKFGSAMVQGAQSKDVLTFMKHFVLNDQETNARSGINVWVNEQALREIYLKPFEITTKEGQASGAMSSFIHLGPKWSGGNEQLLNEVLREEWGFDGVVSTDAVLGAFMDPIQAVRYGNDLMLSPLPTNDLRAVTKALKEDPVGVGNGLRDRVHAINYALLQTDLFH